MTQLTKGKELDNHVLKLCDELKLRDNKAIWKINSVNGALLCSNCRSIIKTIADMTKEQFELFKKELPEMTNRFCDKCKNKYE